jgi:hypothetical protein
VVQVLLDVELAGAAVTGGLAPDVGRRERPEAEELRWPAVEDVGADIRVPVGERSGLAGEDVTVRTGRWRRWQLGQRGRGQADALDGADQRPEIVLGDRFGPLFGEEGSQRIVQAPR